MEEKETIVCSAIKYKKLVFCGIGCAKIVQNILSFNPNPTEEESLEINNNQGFITSTGRFVTREEAYSIARENNQIKYYDEPFGEGKTPFLMSINLYNYN